MTDKQKLIIEFLETHNRQAYYIDIRNSMSQKFEDEDEFDNTLNQLRNLNLVYENDKDTFYKLSFPKQD